MIQVVDIYFAQMLFYNNSIFERLGVGYREK